MRDVNVWLVTVGEPLPLPGHDVRLLRTGRLGRRLAAHGHQVTWWTSDFDHSAKRHVHAPGPEVVLESGMRLVFLHGCAYNKNLSLARIVNHGQVGRAFRAHAERRPRPDVVLCSLPTLELAHEAVRYGQPRRIPVLLDVRDLWPDIFVTIFPRVLRPLARVALAPYFWRARQTLKGATGILAVSEGYLAWGLDAANRRRGPYDAVLPLGYAPPARPTPEDDAAEATLRAHGVDPGRRIVWFIGSFGRTYDLLPVIRTARALWAAGRRDVQFVFSGAGERDAAWRTEAADLPNVVFTGWLTGSQIRAMARMAYVGLAAYAQGAPQGLPNKLFEYLSAGLPVLSSLAGETEALLREQHCGLTYDAADPAGPVTQMLSLLDEPGLHRRLSGNAASTFATHFSADIIDAQAIAHLERVAASAGAAGV